MVVFYFLQKAQSKLDLSQQDPCYASDAELLAAAGIVVLYWNGFVVCCGAARTCVCATWNSSVCIEQCSWYIFVVFSSSESVLDRSEASVNTQLTTWGDLASSVCQDDRPGPSSLRETSEPGGVVLEGWQKFWEQPPESTQALGIAPANIKWLKTNETYGLFERASRYKNVRGEMVERKLFKEKMEFHPPPPPMAVKGAVPNMLSFFTTPAFFWRPVGVMKALIRCPNTNCMCECV